MTFDQRLRQANGHPSGFDVMRLVLAAAVIVQHSVNVTMGQAAAVALFHSGWRTLLEPVLPMFFALSGFLVAGSLFRCRSLIGFCGLRILRIVPALAVEVALSALLLGPLVTVLDMKSYVSADAFSAYFLNVVGFIHYRLPGVFLHNPDPETVNRQLWTVPFELECYIVLAALTLVGLSWRRGWFIGGLAALSIGLAIAFLTGPATALEVTVPGRALILCFLWGVALFMVKERLPRSLALAALAAAAMEAALWAPGGSYLMAVPTAYLTVWLGLANPPKPALLFRGDYSYGMYLYGYPVQQTLVHLWPGMPWFANALAALPIAFGLAQISWWGVETRALRLRPVLHRLEGGALARLPAWLRPPLASRTAAP